MAKKKKLTKDKLVSAYMDYVLMHNEKPKSVYAFGKDSDFDEQEFYQYYASFTALEQDIFNTFFENTIKALEKSDDYKHFEARNKLLSFYYTFFENLTANRSYVVYALNLEGKNIKSMKVLKTLKESFGRYIEELDIKTLDLKQEQLQKIQHRSLKETTWFQLLLTMKFWLEDTSTSFEKTDIFIEKSVNASFDLMDVTPLKSIIDLGKFVFKEKMPSL